jgi:hypothetical protein
MALNSEKYPDLIDLNAKSAEESVYIGEHVELNHEPLVTLRGSDISTPDQPRRKPFEYPQSEKPSGPPLETFYREVKPDCMWLYRKSEPSVWKQIVVLGVILICCAGFAYIVISVLKQTIMQVPGVSGGLLMVVLVAIVRFAISLNRIGASPLRGPEAWMRWNRRKRERK